MEAQQKENSRITPIFEETLYTELKKNTLKYRALFIGFGALFCILGMIAYAKSVSWPYAGIYGTHHSVRSILCFFCFGLSTIALTAGVYIRSDQEALRILASQAKKRLLLEFTEKKLENEIAGPVFFGRKRMLLAQFKHEHKKSLEQVDKLKTASLKELKQVSECDYSINLLLLKLQRQLDDIQL